MQGKVASSVQNYLEKTINNLGFDLYDVEYSKKQNGMNLTLFITKLDGSTVNIQDCELVHRTIDPMLDELNPTQDEAYYLNVSSLGLDRQIKTDKDFRRMVNHNLQVKLFSAIDSKKEFLGLLKEYDDEKITIILNTNKELIINRQNIAKCQENIKF